MMSSPAVHLEHGARSLARPGTRISTPSNLDVAGPLARFGQSLRDGAEGFVEWLSLMKAGLTVVPPEGSGAWADVPMAWHGSSSGVVLGLDVPRSSHTRNYDHL